MRRLILIGGMTGVLLGVSVAFGQAPVSPEKPAGGAHTQGTPSSEKGDENLTPEQRMARRFPQPARVGDLIGLPILDWQDSTIGYVRQIVRTPAGKVQLIVPHRPWFGWVRCDGIFDWNCRPVAVPLEVVAILARQIDVLDMPRKNFDTAPTFDERQATPLNPDDSIKIAVTRR